MLTAQPRIVVAGSNAGNVEMMYGMSKPVASAPLVTVVGRTWESIVAPLRVRLWIVVGVTSFATVLVLLLTLFLYHHVNELRRRDAQLQRINETLEQRVTERTFELERANAHMATVNQELEAFTAAASHDLRSPLSVISGQAGMLGMELHSDTPPQQLERLNRILNAVRHASELIDGLLVLARITTQGMRSDAVNLSDLVTEALTALQENDPERALVYRIDEDAHITADARLMRSLITNLVNNAWKYSRDKERVEIEFRVERGAEGTTFRLRDRGAGFDMSRAKDLFHPFKRLHSMLEFSGTGIGLAIVERIVRRYGGRIWAEAEIGAGATFFFTLPLASDSRVKEVDAAVA